MGSGERWSRLFVHGAFAVTCGALALALAHCVDDSGSPTVVDGGVNVEEGGVVVVDGGAQYTISGSASGVPMGKTVTLTLNGTSPLMVGNGAFSFPTLFAAGQTYVVAINQAPAGVTCKLTNAMGAFSTSSVTNVALACVSTDATLSALAVSRGTLTPAFSPTTLSYTVAAGRVPAVFPPFDTMTLTPTASDPKASILIGGVAVQSGMASAPITLKSGVNPIDVALIAPDGTTKKDYAIGVSAVASDYLKASNTAAGQQFGSSVAISADGNTLAVGALQEASGIPGNQSDTSTPGAGAVYVYSRTGRTWTQQAYLKAATPASSMFFGISVALSTDGNTLAVGALNDSTSGAVHVFTRTGTTWGLTQRVLPTVTNLNMGFGSTVAFSGDGTTLAIGAYDDDSSVTGINGSPSAGGASTSGAAWIYTLNGTWTEQAYIKPMNTHAGAYFGSFVALSTDGNTLAVGSESEASNATGINGNGADTSAISAGAAYVFARSGTTWSQQAYIKASNTLSGAQLGITGALSGDGNTLVVGAPGESSSTKGINTTPNTSGGQSGAAYVFTRAGTTWSQEAYVKASNTAMMAQFGQGVSISADGKTFAVGSTYERSASTGVNGDQSTNGSSDGAAYVFTKTTAWSQLAYLKASTPSMNSLRTFGNAMAVSGDGKTIAVGADNEASNAKGVDGDATNTTAPTAGAVYVF
jgi:hypothetical protein